MTESKRQRVNFRIDEFQALANPERVGRAEWSLRVTINGIERWRSPEAHKVLEGDRGIVDAAFHVNITEDSGELELRIDATEHDIGPDDHAHAEMRLHRSSNFGGDNFYVDVRGEDAHLRVRCSASIDAA